MSYNVIYNNEQQASQPWNNVNFNSVKTNDLILNGEVTVNGVVPNDSDIINFQSGNAVLGPPLIYSFAQANTTGFGIGTSPILIEFDQNVFESAVSPFTCVSTVFTCFVAGTYKITFVSSVQLNNSTRLTLTSNVNGVVTSNPATVVEAAAGDPIISCVRVEYLTLQNGDEYTLSGIATVINAILEAGAIITFEKVL